MRKLLDSVCPLVALLGLYIFSSSFFLAKRSMPHTSECDEAKVLLRDTLHLSDQEIDRLRPLLSSKNHGCWTERRVDSMVIIVVDALRFDFALHHLPMSVGTRLHNSTNRSQLLRFVADPPTVTMQRLKGLTTGGLPTFADISASFGGATVDEDSWVQQLVDSASFRRGVAVKNYAFVGDDTWVDLFPTQFNDSHPFPSFNTRDLDSVDNGCLEHLPRLMESLRRESHSNGFEVVVAHFLGVDHVGHTYGPHNVHMDQKLRQMDAVLSTVLDLLDESSKTCHAALIFGDHGMTEGGNHGGGTEDEVNAALFAHFSPGCGDMSAAGELTGFEAGIASERAFQSIRQIDLVPTISLLLGLPIPYANLGGLVPSLLPPLSHQTETQASHTALALALNAAQVWRYFTVYSQTANKLPSMPELEGHLDDAIAVYKQALEDDQDSIAYRQACGKFKLFLKEAAELGIRVWTRFDTRGMATGGAVLLAALLLSIPMAPLLKLAQNQTILARSQYLEVALTIVFIVFQCVLLTFSNSYIEAEEHIVMFAQAIICIALCGRSLSELPRSKSSTLTMNPWLPLAIPICSRVGEIFVSGHGMDPSIPVHAAHYSIVFLGSLSLLAMIRIQLHGNQNVAKFDVSLDLVVLLLLGLAWWEKRSADPGNGYIPCRIALVLLAIGVPLSIRNARTRNGILIILFRLLGAIMTVTGPSTASSVVLLVIQAFAFHKLSEDKHGISSVVLAALWRFTIRHVFFATNHACAFNRLQYSAAFVATEQFYFGSGGISLFLNTFGWEIVGLIMVSTSAYVSSRPIVWKLYCLFQLLETFGSCLSVSQLRRHLMVWAIFAPRFIFAGIFLVMNSLAQLILNRLVE